MFYGFVSVVPNFAHQVEGAVNALSSHPQREVDENEFIEASRLVYDGVRDIRRAVLMNRVRLEGWRHLGIKGSYPPLCQVADTTL